METVFAGKTPDRTPILGGWIACPDHICALSGATIDEYWADTFNVSVRAYLALGNDGLIDMFVPAFRNDFRCVDANTYQHAVSQMTIDEALAKIDAMPSPEQMEATFDIDKAYGNFRQSLLEKTPLCKGMVWMPAQWWAGSKITWFFDFGYEHFFYIVGAHPDHARRLMDVGGAQGYNTGRVIARAVQEGLFPHAVLLGEDICTQRGPMISPKFIEKYYAPNLRHGLKPLLDAGCKPVWHCDGDVRPILPMLLDCGIQGCQGFQPECGMTIEYVSSLRTRDGKPLLIFGPLAVTTELPVCTPQQIKQKVRHAIDVCRGNADLVLFTGNTINPDVPLANIRAMCEEAMSYQV